jgi:hypothetical protein
MAQVLLSSRCWHRRDVGIIDDRKLKFVKVGWLILAYFPYKTYANLLLVSKLIAKIPMDTKVIPKTNHEIAIECSWISGYRNYNYEETRRL